MPDKEHWQCCTDLNLIHSNLICGFAKLGFCRAIFSFSEKLPESVGCLYFRSDFVNMKIN